MSEVKKREPVTVDLEYEVEYDGKVYEKITLQRPKAKHLMDMGDSPKMKDLIRVAVKCSGLSHNVFNEMDAADMMTIAGVIGDFLANGREIGAS